MELYRWNYTQVEVDWYQDAVSHMALSEMNPLTILEQSDIKLFEQLKAGSIDPARFLKLLDEKIQSIYLEAQ